MEKFSFKEHAHTRRNILTGEYVLVSPHRSKRPWQGKFEDLTIDKKPAYDPTCYLCPGNKRASGFDNPTYKQTFAFNNDFAALEKDIPSGEINKDDLLVAKSESGICRVICFSPKHNLTLAEMDVTEIRTVINSWTHEYISLGTLENINYVQIFENKGNIMGCSNPHPHGQIWAESNIPQEVAKESKQFEEYYDKHGKSLLWDYLRIEAKERERIVFQNNHFVVLVPFWATWPFETIIICRTHLQNIAMLSDEEKDDLAEAIKVITVKYDNLFNISFPYSAGIHQSPTDGNNNFAWHFHIHFYPPLLRSATVKKFMVGYELLGNPQRDITPEEAAQRLRELPNIHYTQE